MASQRSEASLSDSVGDDTKKGKLRQSPTSVAGYSGQYRPFTGTGAGRKLRYVQPNLSMEAASVKVMRESDRVATASTNIDANEKIGSNTAVNTPGPLHGTWNVPQRVKPGRKPATDTPPTKRKAQNRAAQRAFRERRAARIDILEGEKQQIRDEFNQLELQYQNKVFQAVQNARAELEKEIAHWRTKAERLERTLHLERQGRVPVLVSEAGISQSVEMSPSSTLPLTPTSNGAISNSQDIDPCLRCGEDGRCACLEKYTAVATVENIDSVGKAGRFGDVRPAGHDIDMSDDKPVDAYIPVDFTYYNTAESNKIGETSIHEISDEDCGFCDRDGICICKSELAKGMERKQKYLNDRRSSEDANITPASLAAQGKIERSESTWTAKVRPGTCQDCQLNPQQRKICQTLARERPSLPFTSLKATETSTSRQKEASELNNICQGTENPQSMPCSEFFRLFKEKSISMDPDRSRWMQDVYTVPSNQKEDFHGTPASGLTAGHAAYEIAAANILATLNQASRESKSSVER